MHIEVVVADVVADAERVGGLVAVGQPAQKVAGQRADRLRYDDQPVLMPEEGRIFAAAQL